MRILVTSIGSMSAGFIISRLTQLGHYVIGCNVKLAVQCETSFLCDHFIEIPHSSDANLYLEAIKCAVVEYRVDAILPLTDPETRLLAKHVPFIQSFCPRVLSPDYSSIRVVGDKFILGESVARIRDIGCLTIPSELSPLQAAERFGYPLIAKPRRGRSSQGLKIFNGPDMHGDGSSYVDYVFQPFCSGSVCTFDAIMDPRSSEVFALGRRELVRTESGAGLEVEILARKDFPGLYESVEMLMRAFEVRALVNIEFLESGGRFYVMDFNLRASAGIGYSFLAGSDFLGALVSGRSGWSDFFNCPASSLRLCWSDI
jgi:carbamoyl-phosphate synthase large subunit